MDKLEFIPVIDILRHDLRRISEREVRKSV